jgi:hypothetical protein
MQIERAALAGHANLAHMVSMRVLGRVARADWHPLILAPESPAPLPLGDIRRFVLGLPSALEKAISLANCQHRIASGVCTRGTRTVPLRAVQRLDEGRLLMGTGFRDSYRLADLQGPSTASFRYRRFTAFIGKNAQIDLARIRNLTEPVLK